MNSGTDSRSGRFWWIALVGLLLLPVLILFTSRDAESPVVRLPDGTEFELAMVAFTNSFAYNQVSGPAWMRRFDRFIPDVIEKRFLTRGGGISLGNSPETNLMVVLEARKSFGNPASVTWLRVSDGAGNSYDGNSANGVLSAGGNRTVLWRVSTFPRRTKELFLHGLVYQDDGSWTNIGPFSVENPLFRDYPHWQPLPLPQPATNGNLIATLEQLQSGVESGGVPGADAAANPRSTRMVFSFRESGQPADHYRLHRLTLADATGNRWSPFLNSFSRNGPGWTTNGIAEFVGALWPGEEAWRIELEGLQHANFAENEVWSVPSVSLPNPASHIDLTNRFQIGDLAVSIANILAPGVEVTNSWRWTVRYWGQERSVYGLGLKIEGEMKNRRLVVVAAKDQAGRELKLIEHRSADYPEQAIFFQAPAGATALHLKLAVPELRKFEFLARPEFTGQPARQSSAEPGPPVRP